MPTAQDESVDPDVARKLSFFYSPVFTNNRVVPIEMRSLLSYVQQQHTPVIVEATPAAVSVDHKEVQTMAVEAEVKEEVKTEPDEMVLSCEFVEGVAIVEEYEEFEMEPQVIEGDSMEFESKRKVWMAEMSSRKQFMKENQITSEQIQKMKSMQESL